MKLITYSNRADMDYIIACIINIDKRALGFTICDKEMQRRTQKNFRTAERAMKFAETLVSQI